MADPVLLVIAGPNGAGKSTLYERVLSITGLPFINADEIAARMWPGDELAHGTEASAAAAAERADLIAGRRSFATETVFSHPSKLELIESALSVGYIVDLHVVLVPVEVAVARVSERVEHRVGTAHDVPEVKIRERYKRLWEPLARAVALATTATIYDNSGAAGFRVAARFRDGVRVGPATFPKWTPAPIARLV